MNQRNTAVCVAFLAIVLLPETPSVPLLYASTTADLEALREGSQDFECSESTYLRRVFLDLNGYLPTLEEQQSFLTSKSPTKKNDLVNRLLQSAEYSEKWGRWLAFKLGADETELVYAASELGCSQFHLTSAWIKWAQNHTAMDTAYSVIVTELLGAMSRGDEGRSQYYSWLERFRARAKVDGFSAAKDYSVRKPMDLYWRRYSQVSDPESRGEDIAKRFLGTSLECARCHDHPFKPWTQKDHQQFASVFSAIRYTELPFTSAEKKIAILAFVFAVIIGMLSLILGIRSSGSRCVRLVIQAISSFLLGMMAIVLLAYLHLISNSFSRASLAQRLDLFLGHQSSMFFNGSNFIALSIIVIWFVLLIRVYNQRSKMQGYFLLFFVSVICGAFVANGIDWWSIRQSRVQGRAVDSVFYVWQHDVLRILGLGGCGQQPREVFISEDRIVRSVPAKFLGGDELIGESSQYLPRFLVWLTKDKVNLLAESVVDNLLREYFPLLADTSHDAIEKPKQFYNVALLAKLRERLLVSFRQREGSLRALHFDIVTSELYRLPALGAQGEISDELPDQYFPPRRLTAEQVLGSLERIVGCRLIVDEQCSPRGGKIFDVGARYPWGQDFASRVFRLFPKEPEEQDFTMESSMLMMNDFSWAHSLDEPSSWLNKDSFQSLATESMIDHIFRVVLVRSPTSAERVLALRLWENAKNANEAVSALLLSLTNATEFHYVH